MYFFELLNDECAVLLWVGRGFWDLVTGREGGLWGAPCGRFWSLGRSKLLLVRLTWLQQVAFVSQQVAFVSQQVAFVSQQVAFVSQQVAFEQKKVAPNAWSNFFHIEKRCC